MCLLGSSPFFLNNRIAVLISVVFLVIIIQSSAILNTNNYFGTTATEQELQELAVIVAACTFWSNILHVDNYDYDTFVRALKQIGEHMAKQE